VLAPVCVIDAKDGSRVEAAVGHWVLVSVDQPVSVQQKAKLADTYWAHAVDMEAAAVARGAQAHDITFVGLKAISDEADFEMPPLSQFVTGAGQFRSAAFAGFVALRPWLWFRVFRLAQNSDKAAVALCAWLEQYNQEPEEEEGNPESDLRPSAGGRN
jgi:adenosylhomocysteine nucleosidase